jgi:hypothetical protein
VLPYLPTTNQPNGMATSKKVSTDTSVSSKLKDHSQNSNLESFACFWLDQSVDSTQDNRETHQALRQVINHLRTFNGSDTCEQCIREITEEKVVLIVSGMLGSKIVPRLHDLPQLSTCYVFCQNKESNEKWAKKYSKVRYFRNI